MPLKIDPGFVKADSGNLPKVTMFMVWEYLVTDEKYNAPEVRGVKATLSSRESYGDSAVGYVCVKRENTECIVQGKICPEHRVRNKDFTVKMIVDEENEKIKNLECLDCAASAGGCKHGIAFLMWCNRRCESTSPTEVECYWKKSLLSNVGTSQKFILAKKLNKTSSSNNVIGKLGDNSHFFNEVATFAQNNQVDSQFSRYVFDLPERNLYSLSIFQLMTAFCNEDTLVGDFICFAKEKLLIKLCAEVESQTREQSNELLWHELRFGRITASNVYEASRCSTEGGSLVNRIVGVAKLYDNFYMKRGRDLEKCVIQEVEQKLNIHIQSSGFFLIPSYPMLGASPDGIGHDFIVEVKCPSSEKTTKNYILNGKICDKYKGQMHLQMLATGKRKGIFCIGDPDFEKTKHFQHVWIKYEENFVNSIVPKAVDFWKANIFPVLLKSITR